MVKKFCCAMKGFSANQARRRPCECNFLGGRGLECSGVATAHDLYRTTKISMCAQSLGCFEVKVPMVWLGTYGCLAQRREVSQLKSIWEKPEVDGAKARGQNLLSVSRKGSARFWYELEPSILKQKFITYPSRDHKASAPMSASVG